MRTGTLLALGGIGALTHSIVWHQMQTEPSSDEPVLPVYGQVPEKAAAGADDLDVHSCVVVAGEVRIHATLTNTSDDVAMLDGVDYLLLGADGAVVEDVDDHASLSSGVHLLGAGRSVRLVDSNPAPADAAECRAVSVSGSAVSSSDDAADLPAHIELSGCAGEDAKLTAHNPTEKPAAVSFVVEYFDVDGFSLGQTRFNATAAPAAADNDDPSVAINVGGPHPSTTVSGCEVVLAALVAD